jgi:hypothetical protein
MQVSDQGFSALGTGLKDLKSLNNLSLEFMYFNFTYLGICRALKVVLVFSQPLRVLVGLVKIPKAASCIQSYCGMDN